MRTADGNIHRYLCPRDVKGGVPKDPLPSCRRPGNSQALCCTKRWAPEGMEGIVHNSNTLEASQDFLGSQVVQTLRFQCRGHRFNL